MPASIPDMGAINNLGSQFNTNIFSGAQKELSHKSRKFAAQHNAQTRQTEANRQRYAQSAAQAVKQGQAAYAQQQKDQQKNAQQAAKTRQAGVKSGRVAPAQGDAPRTFAMGSTPQQKAQAKAGAQQSRTMQQQRNYAHGEALKFQQAQFKTNMQQRNFAHGQAIQEDKKRSKNIPDSSAETTPSLIPSFSSASAAHTPVKAQGIAATTFSSQLTPQKAVSLPNAPVSPFSHAPAQTSKSLVPGFSSAPSKAPRNLTPSFSNSGSQTGIKAQKIAPTTFSSQFSSQKPLQGPQGATTGSFSSSEGKSATPAFSAPQKGITGIQFSHAK